MRLEKHTHIITLLGVFKERAEKNSRQISKAHQPLLNMSRKHNHNNDTSILNAWRTRREQSPYSLCIMCATPKVFHSSYFVQVLSMCVFFSLSFSSIQQINIIYIQSHIAIRWTHTKSVKEERPRWIAHRLSTRWIRLDSFSPASNFNKHFTQCMRLSARKPQITKSKINSKRLERPMNGIFG